MVTYRMLYKWDLLWITYQLLAIYMTSYNLTFSLMHVHIKVKMDFPNIVKMSETISAYYVLAKNKTNKYKL